MLPKQAHGVRRLAALAFGALAVAGFALTVIVWALLAVFIPPLRRWLYDPDLMTFGNCHIYAWLKYLNGSNDMRTFRSPRNHRIPHSVADGKEFVPNHPKRGLRGVLESPLFFGHVRTVRPLR